MPPPPSYYPKAKDQVKAHPHLRPNKTPEAKKPLLLTPGPVCMPQRVLKQLAQPMIHHRSKGAKELILKVQVLLKKFFQTSQPVLILNANGTGAMAAALLNTLSPKDKVIALCAGRFAARWADMAKAYRLKVLPVHVPWGKAINPNLLKTQLQKHPDTKAVLCQACETSTGVLHPVRELARLTKNKPGTLFLVDAISALGAVSLPMDRWGIDALIGGSQKSFSLPAGMSFIALSKKAWRFNQGAKMPVFYLNLKKELQVQQQGQTAFSTNISFLKALYASLYPLKTHRLSYFQSKSLKLSRMTLKFCQCMGLKVFSQNPSPSVTAFQLPDHIDGTQLKDDIEKKHCITFGGGMEHLKGKILRVGHLGEIPPSRLLKSLKILSLALHKKDPRLFTKEKIKTTFQKITGEKPHKWQF